jgi:NAD(P)H dehydrogenase (quinone)
MPDISKVSEPFKESASMSQIVVLFYSGYGHTRRIAEIVAESAHATPIAIDANGELKDAEWQALADAKAIILGAPTYMGGVPWQFKKVADASSKQWQQQAWKDKIFAGFVNSGGINGDKQVTVQYLQTLASQHGGIWVSLGLMPVGTKASTREDVNNLSGSVGLLVQSPTDGAAADIPAGDLKTAALFGERVAAITARFK